MKGILLSSDNWQGLFVEGKLINEYHNLDDPDFWISVTNEYKLTGLTHHYVTEEDDDKLQEYGTFPELLSELKGEYK